jgi:UDP-N-acetylmuramoylalanine--D-glutamate ligase
LEAFESAEGGVIIIAGGYDKGVSFDGLGEAITKRTKAAVLMGQTAPKIVSAISKTQDPRLKTQVKFARSLAEAVDLARRLAVGGDVVLLSPACASYDMFDNFEHRGREFT